jgi:hypothetical protein
MFTDILEGEKSHDMNSLAELGRTLKIGEEIFENIDKVSILNSNIRWLYPLDVSIFCMVLNRLGSYNQFITLEISFIGICVYVLSSNES